MKVRISDAAAIYRAVDDEGNHYVIYEFDRLMSEGKGAGRDSGYLPIKRYMLEDRTLIERIDDAEFRIIESRVRLRLSKLKTDELGFQRRISCNV